MRSGSGDFPEDFDFDQRLEEAALDLALGAPMCAPPPGLRQRLLDRIAASSPAGIEVRYASGAQWRPMGTPGVTYRQLYMDPASGMVTILVRMAPGARYPSHLHTRAEQCLVIEGDLRQPGDVLRAGDFVLAREGSVHPTTWSEDGNLLLLVADPANEIAA